MAHIIQYNSTVWQGHQWVLGVVHEEISLSLPSGIINGHFILLVRHKQAQLCLQSNLKCYEQISTKFLKNYFRKFSTASLTLTHSTPLHSTPLTHSLTHAPTQTLTHSSTHSLTHTPTHSLTHSLTDAFSQAQQKTGYSYSFTPWQKCLEICGIKTFYIIKCLRVCTVILQIYL